MQTPMLLQLFFGASSVSQTGKVCLKMATAPAARLQLDDSPDSLAFGTSPACLLLVWLTNQCYFGNSLENLTAGIMHILWTHANFVVHNSRKYKCIKNHVDIILLLREAVKNVLADFVR